MTQPSDAAGFLHQLRNSVARTAPEDSEEMAPGLYQLSGFGNVGLVVTGEGAVVIDTGRPFDPNAVLGPLRKITNAPVKYIIYTHGHADHAANAGPLLEEGARRGDARPTIIGHSRVIAHMNRYAALNEQNAHINRLQFLVPPGVPSFPPDEKFIRPDLTYEDHMTFRLGGLTFELAHALGETDDITWVHVPERRAIFSGDLCISGCPNIGNPLKVQRYEVEWAEALEQMAALKAEVLGPGHGTVLRGAQIEDTLLTTARALRYLHDEVVRRLNLGQWQEQIVQEVQLPPALANHPALAPIYGCPMYVVQAIYRRYAGWYDGNPSHLLPSRAAEIAAEVAELAGAEPLLQRAEALANEGKYQLALHLLDFVIEGAADPTQRPRALRLKSAGLKHLASVETSFISRSILDIGAARIDEEANKS